MPTYGNHQKLLPMVYIDNDGSILVDENYGAEDYRGGSGVGAIKTFLSMSALTKRHKRLRPGAYPRGENMKGLPREREN